MKPPTLKKIHPVQKYPCPITGILFDTEELALESGRREQAAIEAQQQRESEKLLRVEKQHEYSESLRLSLKSIKDLPGMLMVLAKKNYNIDITDLGFYGFRFGDVSNSHGAPIDGVENWGGRHDNSPTSYKGWSGRIKAKVIVHDLTTDASDSAAHYLSARFGAGFRGLHFSSGCLGSARGKYEMDIGFYMFVQDFPHLFARYQEFEKSRGKSKENFERQRDLLIRAERHVRNLQVITELNARIAALNTQLRQETERLQTEFIQNNPIELHPVNGPLYNELYAEYGGGDLQFRDDV